MIRLFPRQPRLAVALLTLGVAATAPSALSQQELEEVIVTGSRIPVDTNSISSVPIQSVSEDDIRNSGEINIADIVSDIPALVSSVTAENTLTGGNSLNLRGLGGSRTLTLVNGRRHVAGFRGSQAVDVGTIPRALVKSVEVTTGGASAIYGADAVTGVVNFLLKDDFEGFQIDVSAGIPERGQGETTVLDLIWGTNFDNGRGNAVLTVSYEDDSGIAFGDRSWSRDNGIDELGNNPDPNGPPRAIYQDPTFWLTSQEGSIAAGFDEYDDDGNLVFDPRAETYVDINSNGIADCQESLGGQTPFLAGCWLTNPDGSVRVNQDGIIIDQNLNSSGGDGGGVNFNRDSLYPETDRYVLNFNLSYDFSEALSGFLETKYVKAESTAFDELDAFYDTLEIRSDNIFVPDQLQPVLDDLGYLLLTQDPLDLSDNNIDTYTRETTRVVAGFEWAPSEDHSVEFSINYGSFEQTTEESAILLDRFYASIDSVDDGNGNAVCRSELQPGTDYPIDYFAASAGYADGDFFSDAYYSFTPGQGQCAPLNPFGTYSTSAEAQEFVTARLEDELDIEQIVINVTAVGQFDVLSQVLDGPVGYAAGVEYRDESSDNRLDPLTLGILPADTSFTPGQQVSDVSPFLFSFTSFDNTQQFNTGGEYDVTDVFAEIRLPIFVDREFATELTVDAAVRLADYSTLGSATTWKFGATYAPIDDVRFRATVSEAVRAPNITELFDPKLPIFIAASTDPCTPENVANGSENREANCIAGLEAAGVALTDIIDSEGDYAWVNPLTARFSGVSGGNPQLTEEVANTTTFGVVISPSAVDGLVFSADYWTVEIEDAISAVGDDDILDGCYDSDSYPALGFCSLFQRGGNGGLNFLETGQINFAKLEAEGIDVSLRYDFSAGENEFSIRAAGSRQRKLDRFFNPLDTQDVDPELEEIQLPKTTASVTLGWRRGPVSVNLQNVYMSRQSVDEIEDVLGLAGGQRLYGDAGFFGSVNIADINGRYQFNDDLSVFAAINNLTDEEPFSTQTAWPVGPRGRTFVLGFSYSR